MRKILFKPFLANFFALIALLFYPVNLKAIDYFTVQAKIKPIIAQKSFNQLTKKYIKIKDLRTNILYLTKLESLLNTTYEKFYPSVWSYVRIYEKTEPSFTLAQAGIIIQRGKSLDSMKEYVRSFDGKIEVPIEVAIAAVQIAIKKNSQTNKNQSCKDSESKSPDKICFNLKRGAEFLYDEADPASIKAKNILIVQNISFDKLGTNHPLYTLGKEIMSELSKLGLRPKNTEFTPNINLANLVSKDCNIINKLKELAKNKKSGISKILNSVSKTKNLPSSYLNFNKIIITKSSPKDNKILKTLDIK